MIQMNIIADVVLIFVFFLINLFITGKVFSVVKRTTKNNIKQDSQIAIGNNIIQKKIYNTIKIEQSNIFENKNLSLPKEPVGTPIPNFYGRETELDTIKNYFDEYNSKNRFLKLQIGGIGGIGKTSFIEEFCERYKNLFDETHYWKWPDKLSTKNDLKKQWIYAIAGKNNNGMSIDDIFSEKISYRMKGQHLLVVDNVPENVAAEIINYAYCDIFNLLQCHVIIGTREKYFRFKFYSLEKLEPTACQQLFESSWGEKLSPSDCYYYKKLLKWCNCHTLTIEILGLTLRYKNKNLEWLYKEIQKNKLNFSSTKIHLLNYSEKSRNPLKHLQIIFSLQGNCTRAQFYFLKNLSLFPALSIKRNLFMRWLESIKDYDLILIELERRGYIILHNDNIKIHPLIAELIITTSPPKFSDCEKVITAISQGMEINHAIGEHPSQKNTYLSCALSIVKLFNTEKNIILSKIYGHIGYYNFCYENDEDAIIYYQKALNMDLNDVASNVQLYNNLALAYRRMGKFEQALYNHKIAYKKCPKNDKSKCAEIINDIGLVFLDTGKYEAALRLFFKSLRISTKVLDKSHSDICNTYQNIGLANFFMKNYKISLKYLSITRYHRKKYAPDNKIDLFIAIFYIGRLLASMKNEKSIEMLNCSVENLISYSGKNSKCNLERKKILFDSLKFFHI